MSRFTSIALGVALPVSVLSSAAWADVTPEAVWGDWRTYMQGMGYQISATETRRGDDLTVSDIVLNFPMPENDGAVTMSLGTVDFDQNSDGSVAIMLPETMPITITGTGTGIDGTAGPQEFTMALNYSQTGHSMIASGTPDVMTYLYTAATFAMDLTQLQADGETLSPQDVRLGVSGTNMSSTTTMTIGDLRGYQQSGTIESVTYDLFVKDQENPDTEGAVKGSINGITMTGTGSIPLVLTDNTDIAAMLAEGFDVAGKISYASGTTAFDIKDPENGNYLMTTESQGGDFEVEMGAGGLVYDISQRDLNVGVTMEGMPFPFEVAMGETGFNLAMPVSKSEEVQDFAFGIKMADFTMSDMLWGMFDPAGQLPRDPATVILDLTGKARVLIDWMNPEAIEEMTGAPGELKEVSLGNLVVDAAGARLNGSGDVAFDGATDGIVPGMGNPVGDINLALTGGNGLLDKLVAMGLLPQDQAMGARMMMGLFAVPGDAPDTLKSRIEFTSEGQILANGQRIR